MSRDLADESYYISRGGKIPVKWTAPEVSKAATFSAKIQILTIIGSALQEVFHC